MVSALLLHHAWRCSSLLQFVLLATRFGRDIYAVGGNHEAARLAGINVGRIVIAPIAISGFCAGVAALIWSRG